MRKKILTGFLLGTLLLMLLSGCGKQEGAFQGTVTAVDGTTIEIVPDSGAKILEKASQAKFDSSSLEDLQVKTGDSIYITYEDASIKDDVAELTVVAWQMMIRAPQNDPDAAQIMQQDGSGSIHLTGEDGTFLAELAAGVTLRDQQDLPEATLALTAGGIRFDVSFQLTDCVWKMTLQKDGQAGEITGADALTAAALYAENGFSIPDWVDITPASGEKTTTTGLNLRQQPSTDSAVQVAVPAGTKLTLTGDTETGWYQVLYDEMTLYASADYVS